MTGLSDRELASLAWLGLGVLAGLFSARLRRSAGDVLAALLKPVLLVPLAVFALYVAGLVALASLTPAWNVDLLKDTVIWFLAIGVVLMFRAVDAAKEEGWFLRRAGAALGLTVFLEFYLNFQTLGFWPEFALQGWLLLLVVVDGAARLDAIRGGTELTCWKKGANLLQGLTGLGLLAYVGWWTVISWSRVDLAQSARELLLPVWLTLFALPFLCVWAWYVTWEGSRRQLARFTPGGGVDVRSRLAVLLGYHVRVRDMRRFANYWAREVAEAPTLRAKLRIIREHRARMRADKATELKKAEDLVRYSGYRGTDDEGRQLDRREHAATIRALETLSSAHMGWYRNAPEGRYKAKVAEFLPTFARGLPEDHGITMEVRGDGQAWYAWRRTITGWVFGIGAAGPPPDQRLYDGEVPPKGFPGPTGSWGRIPFERGPDWEIG